MKNALIFSYFIHIISFIYAQDHTNTLMPSESERFYQYYLLLGGVNIRDASMRIIQNNDTIQVFNNHGKIITIENADQNNIIYYNNLNPEKFLSEILVGSFDIEQVFVKNIQLPAFSIEEHFPIVNDKKKMIDIQYFLFIDKFVIIGKTDIEEGRFEWIVILGLSKSATGQILTLFQIGYKDPAAEPLLYSGLDKYGWGLVYQDYYRSTLATEAFVNNFNYLYAISTHGKSHVDGR